MQEWLSSFSNPNFMPHGHCYLWQPEILWTHVVSDMIIAASYYAIPVVLTIFLYKRKQAIPFPGIVGLFVAFIFLCGTTHLIRIYVTWVPLYEFEAVVKALTAFVSLFTAIVLIPKLPRLLTLPDLQRAYAESKNALQALQEKDKQVETVHATAMNREQKIIELKMEVNELLNELDKPARYLQGKNYSK